MRLIDISVALDPKYALAQTNLGMVLAKTGDTGGATVHLNSPPVVDVEVPVVVAAPPVSPPPSMPGSPCRSGLPALDAPAGKGGAFIGRVTY